VFFSEHSVYLYSPLRQQNRHINANIHTENKQMQKHAHTKGVQIKT